ncbi:class I SAM-dependent methyltransferase [Candidatus Cyanaurora vandensis]|uniref:class I SAM-dependent methyltransferase n=1 Tax=Candidatus Cyanaurora vandensis TaxID=2714958 RepID=UPI0037BF7BE7
MLMKYQLGLMALLLGLLGTVQAAPTTAPVQLQAAVNNPERVEKNRQRDVYRHPLETLSFFGLRPEMTVLELWPGGGWYTEILAPALAQKGQLFVTNFNPEGPAESYLTRSAKSLNNRLAARPQVFSKVKVAQITPPTDFNLGPANSVDLVLTFRNIHNWEMEGYQDKVYAAVYQVLKPGGIFGVEEHRAKPGLTAAPAQVAKSGYMPEDHVIKSIEAAGFKLVGKSEINSNPKDTKNYPGGVWTLPPTLSQGDQDRERYLAIGESDRMTLKFIKVNK